MEAGDRDAGDRGGVGPGPGLDRGAALEAAIEGAVEQDLRGPRLGRNERALRGEDDAEGEEEVEGETEEGDSRTLSRPSRERRGPPQSGGR
jgi:hypothetical protein